MTNTLIAGGEPDYRGGLLTMSEYALSEAGAISGRASVRNALVRNGYADGLCFWREYQRPQPAPPVSVRQPATVPSRPSRRQVEPMEALAWLVIVIGWLWFLAWTGSRLVRII